MVDGPEGFKTAAAVTDPDTGTMSPAAVVGNIVGRRWEGTNDWPDGTKNQAEGRLAQPVSLLTALGQSHLAAEYVVEFDIRAGQVLSDAYLAGASGPLVSGRVSPAVASVTGHVVLPSSENTVTRQFGSYSSWAGTELDQIFTLSVTAAGVGNAPSMIVALSAEVIAFVSGDIEGAGWAAAEFRAADAGFSAAPWLQALGGIEVLAIRVYRCPIELEAALPEP